MIKKYFLPGLAILLPAMLTTVIIVFLVNLLTNPFISGIEGIYNIFSTEELNLSKSAGTLVKVRFLILITIFLFTLLIGFLTQTIFMNSVLPIA